MLRRLLGIRKAVELDDKEEEEVQEIKEEDKESIVSIDSNFEEKLLSLGTHKRKMALVYGCKPPSFDFERDDFSKWYEQFVLICDLNGYNEDRQKRSFLMVSLGTRAIEELKLDGPVPDDYDAVVKRCGKIFKKTSAENAMERFYKREKKPDERYSTLVSDLRSLLDIAKPTPVCGDEQQAALIQAAKEEKNQMIKSRLKHAVPKRMRQFLLTLGNDKSLKEMVEAMDEFERCEDHLIVAAVAEPQPAKEDKMPAWLEPLLKEFQRTNEELRRELRQSNRRQRETPRFQQAPSGYNPRRSQQSNGGDQSRPPREYIELRKQEPRLEENQFRFMLRLIGMSRFKNAAWMDGDRPICRLCGNVGHFPSSCRVLSEEWNKEQAGKGN